MTTGLSDSDNNLRKEMLKPVTSDIDSPILTKSKRNSLALGPVFDEQCYYYCQYCSDSYVVAYRVGHQSAV